MGVRWLVFFAASCVACIGTAPAENLSDAETRTLLEKLQTDFEQRPSFSAEFEGEYHLAAGTAGPNASQAETATGRIRVGDGRVELAQRDEKFSEQTQAFVPVREEKSVWVDGRRVGLRRFLEEGNQQPFTTVKKYHDAVRPDIVGWFADGVVFDSEHFSTTLLRCKELEANTVSTNTGARRIHFAGVCAEGTIDVWVTADERHDFVKAKFATSEAYAKTLGGLSSAKIEVNGIEYVDVNGVRLPAYAEAVYTYEIPGEGRFDKVIRATRSSYELNPKPDDANEFAFQLSDGIRVDDYDNVDTKWEWRDGKLESLQ